MNPANEDDEWLTLVSALGSSPWCCRGVLEPGTVIESGLADRRLGRIVVADVLEDAAQHVLVEVDAVRRQAGPVADPLAVLVGRLTTQVESAAEAHYSKPSVNDETHH
jgi:hypothetical protein